MPAAPTLKEIAAMARFEHRFAGLIYQDGDSLSPWARFTPAERPGDDGREVRYGVLETDDAEQIKRLREMAQRDEGLHEVTSDDAKPRRRGNKSDE